MKSLLITFLFFINLTYSQSPAGIWYFGAKAGINFNLGNDPISINDGQLNTIEGCATICDTNGNLLFYSDGLKIWNKNHIVMPNGNNLLGDSSSTQSAVIVPKPNSINLFYLFTVDKLGGSNGLNYNIIDLNLDNGLGDISSKNNSLITPCLEKITVVKHSNGLNFWLITHKYGNNEFLSYEITPSGINSAISSNVGITIANNTQRTIGYMKSSPDGKYLACAHSGIQSAMELFNFDTLTGQLSLISTSTMDTDNLGAYGVEFSSNNKLLYISNIKNLELKSQILQYSIESQNESIINASKIIVAEFTHDASNKGILTGLQLAPNQNIYISRNNYNFLGAINNPNILGIGCQYVPESVNLGDKVSLFGLPTFITSYLDLNFIATKFCKGEITNFILPEIDNIVNINWHFGDPSSTDNTSTDANPTHLFSNSGEYNVTLIIQTITGLKNFTKKITIIPTPIANSVTDYKICEEKDGKARFNLNSKNTEVLGNQLAAYYKIGYYTNLNDAENNTNPLENNYVNIINPQIIFARIQSLNGNSCFEITSFKLIVNLKPKLEDNEILYYCQNIYPEKIKLSVGNVIPIDNYTYNWTTGQNSESIFVNQAGNYSVEVKNNFNCSSQKNFKVFNSDIAKIIFNLEGNLNNYTLIVNTLGTGNYMFSLDNINGPFQNSNMFNRITSGNHIIYVTDLNGCGIGYDKITILGYPAFFTPNEDGINDTWSIDRDFIEYKSIQIFDKFGKLLKILDQKNKNWDGNYIDKKLPSSDYWFKIILNNDEIQNGHFTLKR